MRCVLSECARGAAASARSSPGHWGAGGSGPAAMRSRWAIASTPTRSRRPAVTADMRTLTELVESGALKPLVDARDFELTTAGVGDIVKASMTHRTKGKLVLTVSKQ